MRIRNRNDKITLTLDQSVRDVIEKEIWREDFEKRQERFEKRQYIYPPYTNAAPTLMGARTLRVGSKLVASDGYSFYIAGEVTKRDSETQKPHLWIECELAEGGSFGKRFHPNDLVLIAI